MSDWYVVRATEKDGSVRYLGYDAMGGYMPRELRHACLLPATEREKALACSAVEFFRNDGAKIQWCLVDLKEQEENNGSSEKLQTGQP